MRARGSLMIIVLLAVAGCADRELRTADRLEAAIATYGESGSAEVDAEITALFARLDAEIATARADAAEASGADRTGAEARAQALGERRTVLAQAYLQAKVARLGDEAAETMRDVGRKIGEGIEDARRRLRESMDGTGADDAAPTP